MPMGKVLPCQKMRAAETIDGWKKGCVYVWVRACMYTCVCMGGTTVFGE